MECVGGGGWVSSADGHGARLAAAPAPAFRAFPSRAAAVDAELPDARREGVPSLDGDWDVARTGGWLPPLTGVREHVAGPRGETRLGPIALGFEVRGRELRYGGLLRGIVDVLEPEGDGWRGRTLVRGREVGASRSAGAPRPAGSEVSSGAERGFRCACEYPPMGEDRVSRGRRYPPA